MSEWIVRRGARNDYVEWKFNGQEVWFTCDQFGRVRSYGSSGFSVSYGGIFKQLNEIVLPEARLMVPPVAGRYGNRCSRHRREYCEAIALVLNKRGLWPPEAVQP